MDFATVFAHLLTMNSCMAFQVNEFSKSCISNDIITCFHGDSAWTYPVGKIDDETQRLLQVTEESLYRGLEEAIKTRLSNISHAIQTYVEAERFSVVREYVGHGIGQDLHEDLFLISVHLIKVLGKSLAWCSLLIYE